MTGTSPNAILQIIKGLPKIPGYANSAEQGVDELNLLDGSGFSCDFYDIQLPNMKSGAVYADSPITDGRTLVSGALGNLTETIRLNLSAGSLLQMAAMLSRLVKFRQDCLDFWQTYGQIEPVYLKHQIEGEPGPRYALLYNIEINVETPNEPGEPHRVVTLSIERESAWRGLAPGDNPKRWTVERFMTGQQWNSANADLIGGINHLVYTTLLFNCLEFLNSGTIDRKNYIDIPAASIPGSAPALVEVDITPNGSATLQIAYLARSSKPQTLTNRDGNPVIQYYHFAAVTATTLGTDTTLANDTGAVAYPPTTAVRQRGQISFATDATLKDRLTWTTDTAVATKPRLSSHLMRGTFMVFCRCRQTGAADSDIQIKLGSYPQQNVPVQAGTGNTTEWPVVYLGTVSSPAGPRGANIGVDGRGAYVWDGTSAHSDFTLALQAVRNTGTGVLYVADLILLPIDECCIRMNGRTYDSTGYFTHGLPESVTMIRGTSVAVSPYDAAFFGEISGQPLTLIPGVANRLYFLNTDTAASGGESITQSTYTARLNIVPRWYGFRDV